MRVAILGIVLLLVAAPAHAQAPSSCGQVLTYDPYKPSDLAIVRAYGGTVMSQVPLSTLLRLDPYVPSQGELLRQVGRALPLWAAAYPWYSYPVMTVAPAIECGEASMRREEEEQDDVAPPVASLTTFSAMLSRLERREDQAAPLAPASRPVTASSAAARTQGVWIEHDGRRWFSDGPAIPFRNAEFVRIAEMDGTPLYRRTNAKEDVLYVPTTMGVVAPFRARR